MWLPWALLSAAAAALTAILAKIGVAGVPSTTATAIRTAVVLVLAWGLVFAVVSTGRSGACQPGPSRS